MSSSTSSSVELQNALTVGIIVVGDEILKGHVKDINSNYLCRELWKLGVKVKKISVVGDELEAIADEVRLYSSLYDYVITSGGIGPTHDDVTMEAIGLAFNEEMVQHPDMMKRLFGDNNPSPSNAWIKMAMTPKSATIINGVSTDSLFVCPLMVVRNVYPFPGVPSGLRDTFIANKHLFSKSQCVFYLKEVFFTINEDQLAAILRDLQIEFIDAIEIGSYPADDPGVPYSNKVSIEGKDKTIVEKCYCRLLLLVDWGTIHSIRSSYKETEEELAIRQSVSWLCECCTDSGRKSIIPLELSRIIPMELCLRLKHTCDTIEETLEKYSFDEICLAFNGGKDCTVLMHLFNCVIKKKQLDIGDERLLALYVSSDQPFEEVQKFIKACVPKYNLNLVKSGGSILSALSQLKDTHSSIKAILMGTRYSDPYSDSLTTFNPTDSSWPQYMRVHAILDWSYHHVWLFLRLFSVQYCPLYDRGYTSLGDRTNTVPNSSLVNTAGDMASSPQYLPAYHLRDADLERAGRNKLPVKL